MKYPGHKKGPPAGGPACHELIPDFYFESAVAGTE